jgi:hypothetical protein
VIKIAFKLYSESNIIARKMRGKDPVVGEIQNSSHFPERNHEKISQEGAKKVIT